MFVGLKHCISGEQQEKYDNANQNPIIRKGFKRIFTKNENKKFDRKTRSNKGHQKSN